MRHEREREIRQIDLESKGPRVERGEGSRIGGGAVPCGRRWFLRGEEENFKRKKNVVGFSMGMSYSPSQDRTNTIRLALNDEKGRGEGSLDTGYVHTYMTMITRKTGNMHWRHTPGLYRVRREKGGTPPLPAVIIYSVCASVTHPGFVHLSEEEIGWKDAILYVVPLLILPFQGETIEV